MFKHRGKTRTFKHNFRPAVFLSLTAGLVNICGVLAPGILPANVTGHFAYFAKGVLQKDNLPGLYFLLYILAFLSGSFVSSTLTEYAQLKQRHAPHNNAMF